MNYCITSLTSIVFWRGKNTVLMLYALLIITSHLKGAPQI